MTTEEKAALVKHAQGWIKESEAARDEIPFGFDDDTEKELSLIKIALAALTAEPVGNFDTAAQDGEKTVITHFFAPEGWKLVPVEPTDAMTEAGWDKLNVSGDMNCAYEAMIDAAPTP